MDVKKDLVFIGTFTNGKSDGIYTYQLNVEKKSLELRASFKDTVNCDFANCSPLIVI